MRFENPWWITGIRTSNLQWNGNLNRFFTSINMNEMNKHFIDYINFGGYPEVIFSEKIQANPGRYIKSDIVDKVLLRDLPSLYGIKDVQELNSFFSTLVYYSGQISIKSTSQIQVCAARCFLLCIPPMKALVQW